jgi:hypothetical protein
MSKHDNIYNILGKLASLEPQAPKQENILKQLNESAVVAVNPLSLKDRLAQKLAEAKAVEEELLMPKEKKFAALAEPKDKITYADKIAGAKKDDKKKKDVDESADTKSMSRAAKGHEKYGKEGMQALAKAGREGKDLDKVRDKYNKYDESVNEGEYQDSPNKSAIPAFQRKAKAAPGDDSWKVNQQDLDDEATKSPTSSAGLAKAKERLGMGQQVYDENNAHSSLPGTRRVTDEEHSEYDAAAHTVRKWMRKRGWDPKSEFKPAMKYIIDNLESEHDDTLTDDVKMAACTCHKHHNSVEKPVEEGFPTVDDARKEQGTGKFDVQKTSTGTRYTRKPETFDDGDSEKSEPSDGPKKKGRPAKAKAPERTTSKAWKHKGARVTEAINLETYVADTMAEIEALFIIEKDMGKHNNATTGFDALAKKAGGGKKGQAIAGAQFQKMKKAGQLEEGVLTESSLQAIVRKFGKEVREFAEGGDIDQDLFEALYDYYFDDMPYGVKKGRDADPYEWIGDHFHDAIQSGDVEINETKVGHKDLDELAALAGIGGGQQIADEGNEFSGARASAIRAGKDSFQVGGKTFSVTDASDEIREASCNMTAEGQMCPEHGMVECGGGMMEGTGMKQTFAILDDTLIDQIAAMNGAEVDPDAGSVETWDENTSRQLAAFAKANPQRLKQTQSMNTAGMKPMAQAVGGTANGPEYNLKEGEKKPDFTDVDDDDDETESWTKAVDDKKKNPFGNKKELDECGVPVPMGGMMGGEPESGMNINTSMDTKTGRKTVTVTADGEAAEELAQMLKMAGMAGSRPEPEQKRIGLVIGGTGGHEEVEEEYANEPNIQNGSTSAIMQQGNDLNKPKTQYKHSYKGSDNPMAMKEDKLFKLYDAMKSK